ncbi:protein PAT1 homolog 1 [Tetranychus urticae]|uniref:mRNA decay factor PAT1 domain-containing protein n=1 Tax=Tetranychus urticae TaxID=32264 RepID=T1L1E2_TETUR|nr:protein PAT1 homolog 1 [Tetranychus urticae]
MSKVDEVDYYTFHNNPQQGSSGYLLDSDDSSSDPAWVERRQKLINRLSNDLAIAPEDADDFDALNDETFGAATFDEDWEHQHEKMASLISGPSQYQSPAGLSGMHNQPHTTTSPSPHPPSSSSSQFLNQNNLPCFDSSKVLDCQTIEQGMHNLSTSSRSIPPEADRQKMSSNSYFFGKTSLENPFNNTPIRSTESIWNTDLASTKLNHNDNTNIQMTSPILMANVVSSSMCAPAESSSVNQPRIIENDDNSSSRPVIKRPVRAEDLEAMLLNSDVNRKNSTSTEKSTPKASESNLKNEKNDSGWSPFSMGGFIPNIQPSTNVNTNDQNSQPQAPIGYGKPSSVNSRPSADVDPKNSVSIGKPFKPMTLDELERHLLNDNPNNTQIETKLVQNAGNNLNKFFPGVDLTNNNQERRVLPEPVQPLVSSTIVPPSNETINPKPLFSSLFMPGNRPLIQQFVPTVISRPPFVPFLPGPIPNPLFIQHHQMQHLQQLHQRFAHQRRQFYPRPGTPYQHHDRSSNDDEYAGLMTQSNKEWLIKIQNSALNFTNPYKEDFYFVSFKTKQLATAAKAKKGDNGSKVPALIIPERKIDDSTKVEYVLVQFEGCLGKIRVIDVKCPRKLLDVDPKHPTEIVDPSQDRPMTPIGRAELNAFRRLLLDIEQLYALMLEIDEEDKKMGALPEFQRVPHANRRSDLCNQLFRGVYDEQSENINQKIANVRKGIALIVRSLQVLSDSKQKAAIVKSLLDSNNIHYVTNYRDKGLHHLDFKEILTDVIASLKESQLPEIDLLSRKLNSTSFLN